MAEPLATLLRRVRRRLRINRLWAGLAWGLAISGAAVLAYALASQIWVTPDWDQIIAPLVMASSVAAAVVFALGRVPAPDAARVADGWLGTRDLFATALTADGDETVLALQRQRAYQAAAGIDTLPGRPVVPVRRLAAGGAMLGLAIGLAVMPNPMDAQRARIAAEQQAADEAAEALDAAAEELDDDPAAQAEALAARLEELADELRTTPLEESLTELDDAAAALDAKAAEELPMSIALDGLDAELGGAPLPGAAGDAAAQAAALAAALATGEVEDPAALAERLEQLGAAVNYGLPEVAASLSGAAAALLAPGGQAAAAGAMAQAAEGLGRASGRVADADAARRAAEAIAAAAARARNPGQGASGQGAGQGQGDGQGQGAGAGQGQGAGAGQGQGAGGGGSGGGSGAPGAQVNASGSNSGGVGQASTDGGNGDGPARTVQPGVESADADQQIFDPVDPAEELSLGGTPDGLDDSPIVGTGEGSGLGSDARVPYRQVLGDYAERASATIDQPGYPPRLRDTVRDYFDRLASGGTR